MNIDIPTKALIPRPFVSVRILFIESKSLLMGVKYCLQA